MMMTTALILYFFTFLVALSVLTLLASFSFIENIFFRVITGGSVGTLTSSYLIGVTPTLSFFESCINGNFNFGGYFCIIMLIIMLGTWAFNLFRGQGLVQ